MSMPIVTESPVVDTIMCPADVATEALWSPGYRRKITSMRTKAATAKIR